MKILIIEDDQSVAELERVTWRSTAVPNAICTPTVPKGSRRRWRGTSPGHCGCGCCRGLSGFEICRRLREVKDTPVIIISALADDIDKVRGLGLGADDY